MGDGSVDKAKGRVKEAAGSLTGNEDLKREGRADQTAGKIKDTAGKIKDKADEVIDKAKKAITGDD